MDSSSVEAPRGRRKWVSHNLSNAVVYGGLFYGAVRLPMPALQGINLVGNSLALLLLRQTRAGVEDNFRQALGADAREAKRLAKALFFEYGRSTIDVWRCRSGNPRLFPRLSSFDADQAVLDRACRDGRGFLLVSAHLGNWEMGAISLRAHGVVPAVLGQPELDPSVARMRHEVRRRLGVESIDMGTSMATALRVRSAIEKGRVVALVADRAYEEDHVVVPFFGRPVRFLRSPALLARFCGCPLVPGFFLRSRDGSYRSFFGEPLAADESLDPDADALRMIGAVAGVVERAVREEPQQWFNFFRYFTDPPDRKDSPE